MDSKRGVLIVILVIVVAWTSPVSANGVEGPHLGFSLQGGGVIWTGGRPMENDLIYGGRLALMPWSNFGLEGTVEIHPTNDFDGQALRMNHLSANLIYDFLPFNRFNPYLTAGLTREHVVRSTGGWESWNGWEAGLGLKIALLQAEGRRVDLRLDVRRTVVEWKNAGPGDDNFPTNWILTAGLELAVGGNARDGDEDGVSDRQDKCPDTPRGASVDSYGCPTDSDNDGVFDGLDECPDTPVGSKVDSRGCPADSDHDGVNDGIDRCPDTAAGVSVDAYGCPLDSDHDGVADEIDRCPDTPEGEAVDEWGCEVDSDDDGVPDRIDRCPGTPPKVAVDERGCPVPQSAREIELLDIGLLRLDDVNFASGRAQISPESYPALREVGEILVKWPSLRIEIGGHTDSQGAAEFNQKLSEARARAVFDWLLEHFPQIRPDQYVIRGYGESQPIAGNDTAEGRRRNRRVEFKVLNKESLRREVPPQTGTPDGRP